MAKRELERSVAVSSFDVIAVTKICELSEVGSNPNYRFLLPLF